MNDDNPPLDGAPTTEARPTVKVILASERDHGYAALVELCGEHDMATAEDIKHALRGLRGNVLVDLTDCEFIDSTVIGTLLDELRARSRAGQRLDLVVPPANSRIMRTIQVAGVSPLLSVYSALPAPR